MIDERAIELVNGAVDGALSPDERAELARSVDASRETRDYLAAMEQLDRLLTDIPGQDLPGDLHQQIIDAVALPATSPARISARGAFPAALRYGLATAAGVLLTLGFYESGSNGTFPRDIGQMVGTMAPGVAGSEIDSYSVDEPGLRSSARLEQRDNALVLDVMLDSDQPVDVTVHLGTTGLQVDAVAQMRSQFESLILADDAIRTRSRGQQRFSALLRRGDIRRADKDAVVTIVFSRDGTLLQQGALKPEQSTGGAPKSHLQE